MYQPGSSTIQFAGMNRLIGCIWLQYLLPIYQTKTSRFNRMLCRKTSWRKNFTKTSRSSNFPANGTLMWSTPWVGTQLRLELIWISWQLQHIKVDTYKLTNHNPFWAKLISLSNHKFELSFCYSFHHFQSFHPVLELLHALCIRHELFKDALRTEARQDGTVGHVLFFRSAWRSVAFRDGLWRTTCLCWCLKIQITVFSTFFRCTVDLCWSTTLQKNTKNKNV